eukprot:Ihof_evm1s89 gene=Ihof_evmTU1s89
MATTNHAQGELHSTSKEFTWTKEDLNVNAWEYRDEGGANVILGYIGTRAELRGHVLRLRKRLVCSSERQSKPVHKEVDLYNYVKCVMGPLLNGFIEPGMVVTLPGAFLAALNTHIHTQRPPHRLGMEINVDSNVGLLLPDLTASPSYWLPVQADLPKICVELKPKWGYLPSSPYISANQESVKRNTCRFCMHQYTKVSKGQQKEVSLYCPLDLFSGERERILLALKNLLWTPQNNLKIYRSNQPILLYTKELNVTLSDRLSHLEDNLKDIFQPISLSDLLEGPMSGVPSAVKVLCEVIADILLIDRPLDRIRRVQQLDTLDIETIHTLYTRLLATSPNYCQDGNWDSDDWAAATVNAVRWMEGKSTPSPVVTNLSQLEEKFIARLIRQFIMATTAKDCSLMITAQLLPGGPEYSELPDKHPFIIHNKASGHYYQFSVKIVDTDPKYMANIPKY